MLIEIWSASAAVAKPVCTRRKGSRRCTFLFSMASHLRRFQQGCSAAPSCRRGRGLGRKPLLEEPTSFALRRTSTRAHVLLALVAFFANLGSSVCVVVRGAREGGMDDDLQGSLLPSRVSNQQHAAKPAGFFIHPFTTRLLFSLYPFKFQYVVRNVLVNTLRCWWRRTGLH